MSKTNCCNCGAALDIFAPKCEFCGTKNINMTDIDLASGEAANFIFRLPNNITINGKRYIANSHYKHLKGCYAVMDSTVKTENPSAWKYYKCYTVQGAYRTYYKKGDYGYDVLYIQKFLNWYGISCTADGDYGAKTAAAVSTFQEAMGLIPDGMVGKKTIEFMKQVKK